MNIYILNRHGNQYGPYDEKQARTFIKNGQFSRDDLAWTDGLSAWTQLGSIIKSEKRITQPDTAAAICCLIAIFAPLVHEGFIFLSGILLFAAFVLAIVALVKGRVIPGIAALIMSLIIAPLLAFGFMFARTHIRSADSHSTAPDPTPKKTSVVLTKPVIVEARGNRQKQVELESGTPVKVLYVEGDSLQVELFGVDFKVPISATDY